MKVYDINDFTRGWFVGHFDPTVYKTGLFEAGILKHSKGEKWPKHYHTSVEINYLIKGSMKICGQIISPGQIFVIERYEVADPEFLEDCELVVIKSPSKPNDKFIVEDTNDPA